MAEIPSGTKFLGVGSSVPTPELSGTAINSKTQYYTIEDLQGLIRPYKVYTALLTQSGTDAPVATVLENTLGNIVWSRVGLGQYQGLLSSAFVNNKTFVICNHNAKSYFVEINRANNDSIFLKTLGISDYEDDILGSTSIEIRVYN